MAPNVVAYNALMSVLAKSDIEAERSRALASIPAMREAGLRPDRVSYNTALAAVGSDVARARALTEEMVAEGVTPDAVTLCALLTVCDRADDWVSAWDAFEGMAPSMRLDAAVFNALISACARSGRWGGAYDARILLGLPAGPSHRHIWRVRRRLRLETLNFIRQWEKIPLQYAETHSPMGKHHHIRCT